MPREVQKLLYDVHQACASIARFTSGLDLQAFQTNDLVRSAVERKFEIIGEALNQALKIQPDLAATITNSQQIIHFRHVLIHRYYRIDPAIVWGVVQDDLPKLAQEVEELMGPYSPPQ